MPKIVWVTDPHFDKLGTAIPPRHRQAYLEVYGSPREFGSTLARRYPDADGMLITGDIAEAPCVRRHLQRLSAGWGKRIFFVFGNHDYYKGSFASVHKDAAKFAEGPLVWLRQSGVIELGPNLALCGHEGWYDGRAADPMGPRAVEISDFEQIQDFRGKHRLVIHQKMLELARTGAQEAMGPLREACAKYKKVLFATHVPPFPGATWHEGKPSEEDWLPWMCNVTLGEHLVEVAYDFPDTEILVLCGHTHSPGKVEVAPNLQVVTGKAAYWYPQVAQVLDLP